MQKLGWFRVNNDRVHDFLVNFNRNHASILYRFRAIASYLSKVANFNLPHLQSHTPTAVQSATLNTWYRNI